MATGDPILRALASMEERLAERIDDRFRDLQLDLKGRFDAVHHRLDRLEQEYEMLRAGVSRIESDVGTLKTDVDELKGAVRRVETEIASLKRTIEGLEAQLAKDQDERQDLRQQALEFHRRLGELEGRVREIEERLPND